MTIQKVTLIANCTDIQGNPFTYGYLRFNPSMRLPNTDDNLLLEQAEAFARFGLDGPPAVELYPCDLLGPQQDNGTPGWTYTADYEGCPGNPKEWSFYLLSSNGNTQYLSDIAETPAAQP